MQNAGNRGILAAVSRGLLTSMLIRLLIPTALVFSAAAASAVPLVTHTDIWRYKK